MNRHFLALAYIGVTSALVVAIWFSGSCWQRENMTGLTNMPLRDACLTIWVVCGIMLALSQLAFLVIGVRMKQVVVVVLTGCAFLAIVGFVFLLSMMPS